MKTQLDEERAEEAQSLNNHRRVLVVVIHVHPMPPKKAVSCNIRIRFQLPRSKQNSEEKSRDSNVITKMFAKRKLSSIL